MVVGRKPTTPFDYLVLRTLTMKLTFVGSGGAFTMNNYQSNMILEIAGRRLLIDCGSDIRWGLKDLGLNHRSIDALYISHQHADHIGGMEWLGFYTYFDPAAKKIPLFVNGHLAQDLWDHSLQGGLGSIQGKITTLDDFFDVKRIPANGGFEFEGTEFRVVQTIHVMNGFYVVPSYGLLWTATNGKKVFLTTDTQFCPHQITDFYNWADVIFHDCETSPYKSGVHAHYNDLRTLDASVKSKMWLYHYQDGDLPDVVGDGFLGFVKKGQSFDFSIPQYCLEEAMAAELQARASGNH